MVFLRDDVRNPASRLAELERKYRLDVLLRFPGTPAGLSARVPTATVEALRCEPGVDYLAQDAKGEYDDRK
jgi:hypothetical protein